MTDEKFTKVLGIRNHKEEDIPQFVKDAIKYIEFTLDATFTDLERYADKNDLDKSWVFETFSNKFKYKIDKLTKNM